MAERNGYSRRRLLVTSGAALTAMTAGCSGLIDDQTDSEPDDTSSGQSDDQDDDVPIAIPPSDDPEAYPYVENGEMTVRPYVDVYQLYSRKPGRDGNLNIAMNAMPSPLEDYTITVHYTPLDEHETEWGLKELYRVDGRIPEYNSRVGEWMRDASTDEKDHGEIFQRKAKEHGEKIATIEIPTEAAGAVSTAVDDHPAYRSDPEYTIEEVSEADSTNPEAAEWFAQELGEILPNIGKGYHPSHDAEGTAIQGATYLNIPNSVGSYPFEPFHAARLGMMPYIYEIEHDLEIPYNEPYVLTFGIEGLDKAPDVDPSEVITQTPQAYNIEEDAGVRTTNWHPVEETPILEQNQWEETRHITDGLNTPNACSHQLDSDCQVTVPETRELTHQQMEPEETGLDTFVVPPTPTRIVEDTDEKRTIRATRQTNFGRFSPKPDQLAELGLESNTQNTTTTIGNKAYDNLMNPPNSPIQHLWSVEYMVSEEALEAGVEASIEGGLGPEPYERLLDHHTVKSSEILDGIAEDIGEVAENAGLTHPADQLRLVSDFVQQIPHIGTVTNWDPPGTDVIQHPHVTLYRRLGDCQDFTILANSILTREPFSFDAEPLFIDAMQIFGDIGGHVSTGVPMEQIGASSFEEDARMYEPGMFVNDGLKAEVSGGSDYIYIEMSARYMAGRSVEAYGEFDPRFSIDT